MSGPGIVGDNGVIQDARERVDAVDPLPAAVAELPLSVLFDTVIAVQMSIAPPTLAELPVIVLLVTTVRTA